MIYAYTLLVFFSVLLVVKGQDNSAPFYGANSTITNARYIVQISHLGSQRTCSGTIVSSRYILTSANCTDSRNASDLIVRSGTGQLNQGGVVHNVSRVVVHPYYSRRNGTNDISIIRLATRLRFNNQTRPIRLIARTPEGGAGAIYIGWGVYENDRSDNAPLQLVLTMVLNRTTCNNQYNNRVTKNMVCTGGRSCVRYTGGPLITDDPYSSAQVGLSGIFAFGTCRPSGTYPVFTSIAHYRQFIISNTNDEAIFAHP